jgi:hypothetical protein
MVVRRVALGTEVIDSPSDGLNGSLATLEEPVIKPSMCLGARPERNALARKPLLEEVEHGVVGSAGC